MTDVLTKAVESIIEHHMLVFTNAPEEYDYSYVIPVIDEIEIDDRPGRVVAIPYEYADGQRMRYGSGLYYSTDEFETGVFSFILRRFEDELVARVYRRKDAS